jgi:DUF1365 family protein
MSGEADGTGRTGNDDSASIDQIFGHSCRMTGKSEVLRLLTAFCVLGMIFSPLSLFA